MNTQKYLGSIKWFHDSAKNADYGFIVHETMGDVFFHKKGIVKVDSSSLEAFSEIQIVVFQLDDTFNNEKGKSALNVQLITSEDDFIFLFDELLKSIIGKKQTTLAGHFQTTIFTRISKIKTERSHFFESQLENLTPEVSQGIRKILSSSEILNMVDIKFLHKIFTVLLENDFNVFNDLIKSKLTDKDFFELWIDGFTSLYSLDYISSVIFTLPTENQGEICKKLNTDGTTNLFHKILYNLSSWEEPQSIIEIKKVLTLSNDIRFEDHDKILNSILTKIPPYVKLDLWLDNYHYILDFHSYKLFTITLSANDQKKFVKKVANYVHEGRIELPFQELASIAVFDYEMSENDGNNTLDYSTSIILHIMNELMINTDLSNRDIVKKQKLKIYEIVLKLLKDPKDILKITGYFDECKGLTYASVKDGQTVLKNLENRKPRFHTICDGRKAIDLTKKDVLDEQSGLYFWWCANQKCFDPSRRFHDASDWENYNLQDLLEIFKIQYNPKDLELYLSMINKTNRFFEHLKCRQCNTILHPMKQGNYAFWGVNNFWCKTEGCSENGKEVYLTHCLNGRCEMEIDSRDSVKCKPDGHDQDRCGWYICNYCHSCCSTSSLEKRKYVAEIINHTTYTCHIKGHKDLNQICCNKCGSILKNLAVKMEKYEEILNWMENNKNVNPFIRKFGINPQGKKYFVLYRGQYIENDFKNILRSYYTLGFNIPDINENKPFQLLAEPNSIPTQPRNTYKCTSCNNWLYFKDDREQEQIFMKYHFPDR